MNGRMKEGITLNALKMLLLKKNIGRGLITSQYTASVYQQLLKNNGMTCNMSRKGNCLDNVVMESFIHTLKVEYPHHESIKTRDEAKRINFEYIEAILQ